MRIYEIECFELTQPDGGGMREEHIAYVSTEEVAKKWVSEKKGWPRNYHSYSKLIVVFDSLKEMEEQSDENVRVEALAKLTAREKKVLGLE